MDAGHIARTVDQIVGELDRTSLEATYRGVGSEAHDPELMFKIALYETLEGHLWPAQ